MLFNEAYEERQAMEKALMEKWAPALSGVTDEHSARTTAIVLENYLQYLESDARLIAEDQIQTGNFTGVNLALVGLISRVIPSVTGFELVGSQALPSPRSPIFTMRWFFDNNKGKTRRFDGVNGDELWRTPIPEQFSDVGLDPFYSSSQVVDEPVNIVAGDTSHVLDEWTHLDKSKLGYSSAPAFIFNGTVQLVVRTSTGAVKSVFAFLGAYGATAVGATNFTNPSNPQSQDNLQLTFAANAYTISAISGNTIAGLINADLAGGDVVTVSYEYNAEGEGNQPEISFQIEEQNVELVRRQLRGKYTLDAAYDIKNLHGINLDSELTAMMKTQLSAEINREIISDLRMLAGITGTIDYANLGLGGGMSIQGNYDDAHKLLLDAITKLSAKIWNQGRLGYGNWFIGNPETLAFIDRVGGFVGSGANYDGKELSYAGSIGKMKVYKDPLYKKDETLIGYKGNGALETGYIHCPYLPITATPTIVDPTTGDPSKIFYTRYAKTFYPRGKRGNAGTPTNLILNGERQYARLSIKGMPTVLSS